MDSAKVVNDTKAKFEAAIGHFNEELKKLRTGRAHASMLDSIKVEAYGSPMPLIKVATVSAPEPQLLQISPFDPSNLQAISNAIRDDQSLGLNPVDDGRVIRLQIPPLTTERRQQIVKLLNDKLEECMITMRQARHDAMKQGDQAKKDKQLGDDEHSRFEKQIDELMNNKKAEAESLAKTKEAEILKV